MRRVLVLLVAGTLVSGLAAAYAGTAKRGAQVVPAANAKPGAGLGDV